MKILENIFSSFAISLIFGIAAFPAMAQETDSIRTHVDIQISRLPNTKQLFLYEAFSDPRFGRIATYDFVDGKCSFDVSTDAPREMEIIFDDELQNGAIKIKKFYAEGDTVQAKFYGRGENADCVSSSGVLQALNNSLNAHVDEMTGNELKKYRLECEKMEESGESVIEEMRPYYLQLKTANGDIRDSLLRIILPIVEKHEGNIYSEAYIKNLDRQSKLALKGDTIRWNYLTDNDPSLFGLMEIRGQLYRESPMLNIDEAMEKLEQKFNAEYADLSYHPYYEECKQMFATRKLQPGRKYDACYKIHSVDGKEFFMSELTGGKPAIIDLWASWCGSCRRSSKALIPVYEKYKSKGLAYVAVARESGNANAMLKAVEHDGYPWQSFIDIDDADGVWAKNGCPNAGGKIFLIDAEGIIVAVNPTPEQVEEYLKENL